ncbi:hypothetical protein HXX76_010549 [Chlamydomonas incerta]|uniref:Cytochrome P450 n=1 Tax=Chlamydomonas incerta TaxID=51695 RepID=A0A835SZQ2_CHLIN|nr:hypothetical protein HXX76_010549 [Chlamydomonas incerta]|eukprot:KAG2429765.1 hypothetical protein HXX76_010549 [Chlamydomonas incerta]
MRVQVALGRKWAVVLADVEMQRQVDGPMGLGVGFKLRAHALIDPDFTRGQYHRVNMTNLFRASGDTWRQLRAAWQPAFAPSSLSGYLPLMTACADQLAARLEAKAAAAAAGNSSGGGAATAGGASTGSVDMWRELGGMTLQVVGSTAYGVDFHSINEDEQDTTTSTPATAAAAAAAAATATAAAASGRGDSYGRQLAVACGQIFRYTSSAHGSPYLRVAMLFPELRRLLVPLAHTLPDTRFAILMQARDRLSSAVFQLIDSWKLQHSAGSSGSSNGGNKAHPLMADLNGGSNDDAGSARQSSSGAGATSGGAGGRGVSGVAPGSFLDLMLGQRQGGGRGGKKAAEGEESAEHAPLTDEQVAGQVQLFILAGYETTANALAFAVYCIATHPEVESALLREVDEVLGAGRLLPGEANLPRLAYTEAVVNEALRLFPPAHLTSRVVPPGEVLTVGGFSIPAGTPVFLPMYIPHRDPAVWPRVEEFLPERFLPSSPLYESLQPRGAAQQHAHAPFGYGSRMCIGYKFAMQAKLALATLYRRLTFKLEPGQQPLQIVASLTMAPRGGLRVTPPGNGPRGRPVLGCMPQLRVTPMPLFLQSCAQTYGPVFKVALGRKWVVVLADAEMQRQVGFKLRAHARTDPDFSRGRYHAMLSSMLLRASGDTWRQLRAAWQPAFAPASLSGYLPLMTACADQLAARLEAKANAAAGSSSGGAATAGGASTGSVDMWRELGGMTLQVVGSTAYGVDFHSINAEEQAASATAAGGAAKGRDDGYGRQLAAACGQIFRYGSPVHGSPYLRVAMLFPELRSLLLTLAHTLPDKKFEILTEARNRLSNVVFQLIDSWKLQHSTEGGVAGGVGNGKADMGSSGGADSARQSSSGAQNGAGATGGNRGRGLSGVAPGSFLDLMLGQRQGGGSGGKKAAEGEESAEHAPLTDEQVAGQVQLFILAGYETTANALAFAVYCIATHPEVESALLREVDEVLGAGRLLPGEADLPRLAYTEAVVNEALRLFPPAHLTSRVVPPGEVLTVGGFSIPAGTAIYLPMYLAHRDPAVWPRVEEFLPERFIPSSPLYESLQPRGAAQQHAHAPFGYGSRMCIGYKFAMQEAKVALATLYRRLTFKLDPGQQPLKLVASITMSPRGGLRVTPVLRPK